MKMNMCSNRHKRVHLARWEPSPGSQIDQDHPLIILELLFLIILEYFFWSDQKYHLSSMINSSVINNNSNMITPVAVWSQIMIPVWSEKHWQYNYFWSHCHWNNHFWSYWNYYFFHFILYRNNPDHIRIIISFTFIFWGLVKWAIGLRKLARESRPNMCRKIFQFMFRGFIFQLLFEYFFKIGLFTFLESLNSYSVYIFKYFNWCSIHIFKIFQFIFWNLSFHFQFIFSYLSSIYT